MKGVFKFQRRGYWRNWRRIRAQAWGCPHGIPSEYQEPSSVKAWGCPRHPLFFIDYHEVVFVELSFYHFTYYVLCLEHLFTFSFFLFAGHMLVGSLLCLCGRETRSVFSFEYFCASLIPCWVFLATVCLLVSSRFSLLSYLELLVVVVKLSCSSLIFVRESFWLLG